MARNRVLYLRRRTSWPVFIICMIYFSFVATPKIMLSYLMKGEFDLFMAFNKGIFWNFTHFKGIQKNPKLVKNRDGYDLVDAYY